MNLLPESAIFEVISGEERPAWRWRWWRAVQLGPGVPFAFGRGIALTSDMILVSVLVVIGLSTHASAATVILMELLFAGILALMLVTRLLKHSLLVVCAYLTVLGLGSILNLAFPGAWGNVGFYSLCVITCFRLPRRWSLPLVSLCILAFAFTNGMLSFLPLPQPAYAGVSVFNLILLGALCWFGLNLRAQYRLVVRLHEVQRQLQEQMARNAELAAEHERTRIARDIHDVLSHSLAVLSIQLQAARHLLTHNPERLASKLDDMAALLRESITESRQVVGLLRVQPAAHARSENLGESLSLLASTFNERTGIHCHFSESGAPQQVSAQQWETLHQALREMLTNAHRHGTAEAAEITLRWQDTNLSLAVHDNGQGSAQTAQGTESINVGGHHGIEGMRERAMALDGEVIAGPAVEGGFTVTLHLPLQPPVANTMQKERTA
ncbi:sensor histidine kinase [Ktedonobacter robiniae]|uniref:histidine kinase n=1 Tax=Ktedonobacter robiniae TaxID=2778365 RepID=A0ABQ3UVV5_9CHLR|nr:sensor histidine kinase [Ktedonobacter robiniae]GHO56812.1 hypothetical protein KSB_52870 [Ktedonobacter robiniae]